MRILVTGNMGYVGPGVVREIRTKRPEADIWGLDTALFAHCLTAVPAQPEFLIDRQVFGDVRDVPDGALRGTDAVVHLAAISNDPMGNTFERVTIDINQHASVALARRAKAEGVRHFVFASSCSVYGAADDGPRTEDSPLNPLTAYARSKIGTEQEVLALANERFRVTCLRFATACGMSSRLRLDLVLNDFVAGAVTSGRITILSDGTPWRPLIHVDDMARAIEWAIEREDGEPALVLNAGSNVWNYQVLQLAEAVAERIPGVDVSVNKDAPPDKRSYRVDFSRFERMAPAHQPRVTLREAVDGLRSGLQAMGFADPQFRESTLIRLRVLAGHLDAGRLDESLRWTPAFSGRPAERVTASA